MDIKKISEELPEIDKKVMIYIGNRPWYGNNHSFHGMHKWKTNKEACNVN